MNPSTSVPTSSSASGALMEMIFGFQPSRALCVAAELDIAEHLRDDAMTVDELARLTETEGPLLYRLLRALAAAAYDFADTGTIVDVAGGQGALLAAILRANPGARGVLVELPHVIPDARAALQTAELGDRCTVTEGDMFASLPAGGNAYLLKR